MGFVPPFRPPAEADDLPEATPDDEDQKGGHKGTFEAGVHK